jgi:hypothetical protein
MGVKRQAKECKKSGIIAKKHSQVGAINTGKEE